VTQAGAIFFARLVTKTDIHFWKIAAPKRQKANLWRETSFNVGGWPIFFSPVPRQT
jgi:hypothetical protein